jgi:hypothetical protein
MNHKPMPTHKVSSRDVLFLVPCVNGTVAVHERLRQPFRQSEAALVRGLYITLYSICVALCHQL